MAAIKRTLAGIVGAGAAAALVTLTPMFEGTKLGTYRDLGGVLTYCTGATENAVWGKVYSPAECQSQLERDLLRHAEGIVPCLPWDRLTDGQKVAFVDFAYNVGINAFCASSVARRSKEGDMKSACDALMMWNMVKGKVISGLTRRRTIERAYCLGQMPSKGV